MAYICRTLVLFGGCMNNFISITGAASAMLILAACSSQEEVTPKPAPKPAASAPAAKAEAKAPEKAPAEQSAEKAKATKLAGDVGLLDTEKNYMILVTKEGKLVTIDFDARFQPTQKEPVETKVADIGLGCARVVQYPKKRAKKISTSL